MTARQQGAAAPRGARKAPRGVNPSRPAPPTRNGHGQQPQAPRFTRGRPLGELLVQGGLITEEELADALARQPETDKLLGELLVDEGALDPRALTSAIGAQMGVQVADLRHLTPDPAALARLPEAVARQLKAVPLREGAGGLEIAVAEVPDLATRAQLAQATGVNVNLMLAAPADVQHAIDASYRALDGIGRPVRAFEAAVSSRSRPVDAVDPVGTQDAPVVEVVNAIVTQALRDRASDIHIEPQGDRVRVRYRVDGALREAVSLPAVMGPALVSRIKIMAGMNIVERRRSQDGQFTMAVDGEDLDVRVATGATITGETAVLRLLEKGRSLYHLGQLGMSRDAHTLFSRLVRSPFGMVVCAGPTGSGKTTTLYAALSEINTPDRNIMTIEDPVEYVVPSINQTQINEAADVTFANGLKAILRQDPDVMLVGEIRDVETARIAVQSALTGHLVLSSLHATDSVSALMRFLDMGIESFLIAGSVLAVVGQRLVRRMCTACRAPYKPTAAELAFYRQAGGAAKGRFWHGEGCNFCSRTGYQDRIGVYEVLVLDEALRELVVRRAGAVELRAAARKMRTLKDEGLRLVGEDVTTISEFARTIYVA